MNKKVNTLLFVIGGILVNIILFFAFLLLFLFAATILPETVQGYAIIGGFLLSIFGSFFCYSKLVQLFMQKVDMEKYFHPIFKPKNQRNRFD